MTDWKGENILISNIESPFGAFDTMIGNLIKIHCLPNTRIKISGLKMR